MLILIFLVLLSLLWIQPQFNTDGVAIKSVSENSTAYDAGIRVIPNAKPTSLYIILSSYCYKVPCMTRKRNAGFLPIKCYQI